MSAKVDGQAALESLDRALAARPKGDGHAFTATTEHLCAMRDALIDELRGGGAGDGALRRLNAIISTVLAGHFPLGKIPWPEVEHAREMLAGLVSELSSG